MVHTAIIRATERRRRRRQKKLTSAYDIYQLVVGEIGLPRREFLYEVTFWEVRRIIKGYRMRNQTFCEMTRWQTWWLLQPHVKKDSIKRPEDLATFPLWEKDEVEEYSEEDVQEIRELIRQTNKTSKP